MTTLGTSNDENDWLTGYLAKHDPSYLKSNSSVLAFSPKKKNKSAVRTKGASVRPEKRRSCGTSGMDEASKAAVYPVTATGLGTVRAASGAVKEKGGEGTNLATQEPTFALGTLAPPRKRASVGSRRRGSLDIGGLEAVRERVSSATALWAVVDDGEEADTQAEAKAEEKAEAQTTSKPAGGPATHGKQSTSATDSAVHVPGKEVKSEARPTTPMATSKTSQTSLFSRLRRALK